VGRHLCLPVRVASCHRTPRWKRGEPAGWKPAPRRIAFDIPNKESRSFSWRIQVPDGAPFLTYKRLARPARVRLAKKGYCRVVAPIVTNHCRCHRGADSRNRVQN